MPSFSRADVLLTSSPVLRDDPRPDDVRTVQEALAGDDLAMRQLVIRMAPVVRARVVRVLARRRSQLEGRTLSQEVDDFVQETFLALLTNEGHALASWTPERGLDFERFVGFLTERTVGAVLRTKRRNPWSEAPTEMPKLEACVGTSELDGPVESRDLLDRILDLLPSRLSDKGLAYFHLLFVEQLGVQATAERMGSTKIATYAWQRRLRRTVQKLRRELEE